MNKTKKYHVVDNKFVQKFTIKEIFQENWDHFVCAMYGDGKPIRPVVKKEINKIIDCQNPKKGHALYYCPKCLRTKQVPFTCKSRFCNSCGAKYSADRSFSMSAKLLDCEHRHVVFTIAEELRYYFAHDRCLLHLLFEAVENTISFHFSKRNKAENFTPGFICVLHTFGRDLKWNPHIHVILSTKALGNSGTWKHFAHINYASLRKSWQYSLLKLMTQKIKTTAFKLLVDKLYNNHKNGFYVNAPPIKHFSTGLISYITRYTGRPVLAQSRIKDYDGQSVTFTYTPHDSNEVVSETISVFDFIKRLIIHIPDKNFKMIRYYGFYSIRHKKHNNYLLRMKKVDISAISLMKRASKSWRYRIFGSFFYDPLKCICGSFFELIDIFYPPSYKIPMFQTHDSS